VDAESKRYGVLSGREKGVKVRKLIVSEFVSLDGVMEAPGGEEGYRHTGWTIEFHDPGQMEYKLDEVLGSGALLLGRVTYEASPPRGRRTVTKQASPTR